MVFYIGFLASHKSQCEAFDTSCRHYMDVVLIAVVVLCTVENDVIHAAYLAIALLLFRRRDTLRYDGNKLFKWLPLYNFLVMLVTLIYQAPWPALYESHSKHDRTQVGSTQTYTAGCNLIKCSAFVPCSHCLKSVRGHLSAQNAQYLCLDVYRTIGWCSRFRGKNEHLMACRGAISLMSWVCTRW